MAKGILMIISFGFIFSALVLFSGYYSFPKNKHIRLDGVSWFCISIVLSMCFEAFAASVINLIQIPVNLISLGIINLGVGGLFWLVNLRTKRTQQYFYNTLDIFYIFILITVVSLLAWWQFGPSLEIRYETSDPSIHFQLAREIANSQEVSGMFFTPLNNAIFLEIVSPFILLSKLYKVFILTDILSLALAGFVFFATINRYLQSKFLKLVGMIVVLAYIFGYPLNNTVFGFFYLGLGVTLVCSLFFFLDCYVKNEIEVKQNTLLIGLVALGVILCYSLFAPVVYISTFICLVLFFLDNRQLISKKAIVTFVVTLMIPGLIGLYYGYFNYFGDHNIQANQAIQFEGYIYRDLFSNFVLILPFAMFGFVQLIKHREKSAAAITLFFLIVYMVISLYAGMNGKVSSYYYFKSYYLLWMVVFYLLIAGIYYLSKNAKSLILVYFAVWMFLAVINFSGLEHKVNEINYLFDPEIKSPTYFGIYNFNKMILETRPFYDKGKVDLYRHVYTEFLLKQDLQERIPFAGDWLDCYWYEAITNQVGETTRYWIMGEEVFLNAWDTGDLGNFIVVMYDGDLYEKYSDYFDDLEKVYENSAGFIAKQNIPQDLSQ